MDQAGLRHELKYEISLPTAALLQSRLRAIMRPDPHAGPYGYYIRSLYFDDLDNNAYREKLDGLRERSKLRLRFYNFRENYIVFENKEKIGDLTRKTSMRVSKEVAQAMIDGNRAVYDGVDHPLMERFRALKTASLLQPRVLVDYRRIPFVYPDSNVRITLDLDVSTAPFKTDLFRRDLAMLPVLDEGRAVLEVKFDHFLPPHLAYALEDIPKARLAISKYVKCLNLLE